MKRFLSVLILTFLLVACNDGDLEVSNFNFSNSNLQKCTSANFLYKINGKEAILLQVPNNLFKNQETRNEITGEIEPVIYTLNNSDALEYRLYNESLSTNSFCSQIPMAEPTVNEYWKAVPGATIEITTIAVPDTSSNSVIGISAYSHYVVFKDVVFKKGSQELVFSEFNFGSITIENPVKFNFTNSQIQSCQNNDLLFKVNSKEALVLDLESDLFVPEVTTQPRIALLNTTNNRIIYKVFESNISGGYFCSSVPLSSPIVIDEWYAESGVESISGWVEVSTSEIFDQVTNQLSGYKHSIVLKNTKFTNAQTSFTIPSVYFVGEYNVGL